MNRTKSFVNSKHKQMMKSGAPPDKFRVLHCLYKVSQADLILWVITLSFRVLSHFFRDGMFSFNIILKITQSNI